jgi:hypothetical protein
MCAPCNALRLLPLLLLPLLLLLPPLQVGVMWHVECGDGIVFPFSRGCSFITLSQDGRKIQTVSWQVNRRGCAFVCK